MVRTINFECQKQFIWEKTMSYRRYPGQGFYVALIFGNVSTVVNLVSCNKTNNTAPQMKSIHESHLTGEESQSLNPT